MTRGDRYAAALRLREQRLRDGWRAVGRKIGFTNRAIWARYGVHEPIWGSVFDRTLLVAKDDACTLSLEGLAQPRIAAANGLHGRLVISPTVPAEALPDLARVLPGVQLELRKGETVMDRGSGENVLGSPLLALGHLVELLSKQRDAPALSPGEIVTAGTLTDAHPVASGENWSTRISGMPLNGLSVRFA